MPETAPNVPERPTLDGLEAKWSSHWDQEGVYSFDRPGERSSVFSIDTPPPTVSGSLHIGHAFSYTHTDIIARFHRMRGKHVFYPMGWDDNGLPTERRVQNYFGVRCEPSMPYDPNFVAPEPMVKKNERPILNISRQNFIELCQLLTTQDEKAFEQLWRTLGLSVDWSMTYTTIGRNAQRVSQRAFIKLLKSGAAYQSEAPTLWDVGFRTAVAQAELEDREHVGAWHRISFAGSDERPIHIETTRPELLPACVALIAHPDDERYQPLFGTTVTSPVFHASIPVIAHKAGDPERGTGIAMCCTFGDLTDVQWWRELALPTRTIIGRDGRILPDPPTGLADPDSRKAYAELAGCTVHTARERIVSMLRAAGKLDGEPRTVTRPVKFYEKGDKPLEIVSSRQWFIRSVDQQDTLLERGAELCWHPSYMKARYDDWVCGLNGDWLISRQRFFGVPFPIWYSLDQNGEPNYEDPILPQLDDLPIDPSSDTPAGYSSDQRNREGGFIGEADIMDTWATSSLSPQIVCGWDADPDLFAQTFPMDLRPQAHDIIRTWLFATVLRSELDAHTLPWWNVALSGWILDPDRKKMSKSKGNVTTPLELLERFSADAVRYWAANGRPGTDTAFDESQMKIGRRLATKLLNASRFVLGFPEPDDEAKITEPIDRAMLANLDNVIRQATNELDNYEYTTALVHIERFFWIFCDDYLELVKHRAYQESGSPATQSARLALRVSLSALLRLFAPFLPFSTEEAWSWWHDDSIHANQWPTSTLANENASVYADLLPLTSVAIQAIRKAKSNAKRSMRSKVNSVRVEGPEVDIDALILASSDLRAAGSVTELNFTPSDTAQLRIDVELADE